MNPLRWDVLGVAFVLALPLLLMTASGAMTGDALVSRLPWCLVAAWAAVTVLRWAATPSQPDRAPHRRRPSGAAAHDTDEVPAT